MSILDSQDEIVQNGLGKRLNFKILIVLSLCLFVGVLSVFWVGFIGSDDSLYWEGATGWLTQFPYVGNSHWSLRHTVVIPIAIARLMLGEGMPALFLPTLLYALGLIVVLLLWTRHAVGMLAAAVAAAFIITDPQVVLFSSTADVDIPELFFIIAAFFVMEKAIAGAPGQATGRAATRSPSWQKLLASGVLMGFAMLSRETTVFAIAAFGVLFLFGYGMERRFYFLLGASFAVVVGLEIAYLWAMTGNPFYRSTISIHHDSTIDRWADQGAAIPYIHPLIDPVTMLLLNHNFGLLTWVGVPLVIWLIRKGGQTGAAKRLTVFLGTLSLTWAVLAAGLWHLLPLTPRYFMLPTVGVSVLAGVAVAELWQRGRKRVAVVLGAIVLAGNLLAMSVDNRNFMFGEHRLVDLATETSETIHTDPQTLRRADLLLVWAKVRDRVTAAPAATGDILFYNPARADGAIKPGADWTVVNRVEVPEGGVRWLACRILPVPSLPPMVVRRLGCGAESVTLYRLP